MNQVNRSNTVRTNNLSRIPVIKEQNGGKDVDRLKTAEVTKDMCNDETDAEYELIRKLLKGYDKNVRPVKNKKDSIRVEFDLAYNQLVDLVR